MNQPTAPLVYEVATRQWLARLSSRYARPVTLGDVPQDELEAIAGAGFDYLWAMGVWRTGPQATRIARDQTWLQDRWTEAFPQGAPPEIVASPFAVAEYAVDPELGGEAGLSRLRRRLEHVGVGLILDVVAHHTGIDAPWLRERPDWYVAGSDAQQAADPAGYMATAVPGMNRWIAHCRDPYFPPWTDAAPLDYRNPAVHAAMTDALRSIAARCDGVRADMAMLSLSDVFHSTWDERSLPPLEAGAAGEFWATATAATRDAAPGFIFVGEAYWGLEWRLQRLGFDYTYDKTFHDRLVGGTGVALAAHLGADVEYQRRSVRFLENHDEERAAATLPFDRHRAGTILAATVPGLFLVHDGQLEGARIRSPVQFARRPDEPIDPTVRDFYHHLLAVLAHTGLRRGAFGRLDPAAAWSGNPSHAGFVAGLWTAPDGERYLSVANLGSTRGQCRLIIPDPSLAGRTVSLVDMLGPARYERSGDELLAPGLFLDLAAQA